MKLTMHNVTQECLVAAADAHHIAGKLMVEKKAIDRELTDAAKQLRRTANYLDRLAKEGEDKS